MTTWLFAAGSNRRSLRVSAYHAHSDSVHSPASPLAHSRGKLATTGYLSTDSN